ncbi:hypothetical protein LCER1_G006825 [Lachnellula cervina]|uniref:BTB domain-containing protein n=1 Tax=Lachnellula cervina TaxID=1316786 RepID=A0A7D8ULF4_9HELO|nr:hypothetical protein LCER1_G006825 [Lachnellula cervina]
MKQSTKTSPSKPVEAPTNRGTSNEMEIAKAEKGLKVYSYSCVCDSCVCGESGESCEQNTRIRDHASEISRILAKCPDIATLIVGPCQSKITCHKTLLGFKSEYFDGLCFGGFPSSESGEIRMEEEQPEAIAAFVSWLYTGRISSTCTVAPAALWVLGDKLRSPGFTNEAMHFLFRIYYQGTFITAETAGFSYDNTTSGSKLRLFIKDVILNEGPLSKETELCSDDIESWRALIRQGGDLLVDISFEGSFNNFICDDDQRMAWYYQNHHKYLEPITTRPIEDFLQGKPREGTRNI